LLVGGSGATSILIDDYFAAGLGGGWRNKKNCDDRD
jgi:hypothetical protein